MSPEATEDSGLLKKAEALKGPNVTFHEMPPAEAPLLTQRPILSPIGQLLPVEGACFTCFPSRRTRHSEPQAKNLGTRHI